MSIQEFHDAVVNLQPVDLTRFVDEIPEFQLLGDCAQSAPNHCEGSVLIHANMAAAVVLQLLEAEHVNPVDQVLVYIATILHDIGKPKTFAISPKHGRITAYGHDEVGVPLANEFLRKYFPEFTYKQREVVTRLVEWHMRPREWMKQPGVSVVKMKMLSLAVNTKQLYILSQADTLGRIAVDFKGRMFALELFKQNCEDLGIWDRPYRVPLATSLNDASYSLARWNILFNHAAEDQDTYDEATETMIQPPKPNFQLMLLIGAPGSGKSTVRQQLVAKYPDLKVISMDDRRKELTGDANNQSRNKEVFSWQARELQKAMENRQNTIIDATNTSRKLRATLWRVAREHGALCSAIYFDLPLATLLERNAKRERNVPEDVVKRFYETMQSVCPWEADMIQVIDK
ncbi:MAG: AAA family ATPase [bacterium]